MTNAMTVLVCDTLAKALEARQFLIKNGYADASIADEQVTTFTYDAATYSAGASDTATGKIIVIGRK